MIIESNATHLKLVVCLKHILAVTVNNTTACFTLFKTSHI